jgi:uncharacterized delta-60 repeat protein
MWPFSSRKIRPRNSDGRRRWSYQPRLEALERREVPTIAGSLDPTFGTGGQVLTNFGDFSNATSTAIQSDGKIVVAGTVINSANGRGDFAVARYNSNGNLDTTFNGTGEVLTDVAYQGGFASSVVIQSDGKIVVAGQGTFAGGAVVRYNSNGSLDTTFNGTGEVTTPTGITKVAIQSDGKLVAAGWTTLNFTSYAYVARYNADGSRDTTLNVPLVPMDTVYGLGLQSDGKIVVAGSLSVSGTGTDFDFVVVRYNSNGSLDTTFNGTGQKLIDFGGQRSFANSLAIQPDGKIVVVGFGTTATVPYVSFDVARCNSDGNLDATFNGTGEVTTDFNGSRAAAYDVALQSDGKIVAAGYAEDPGITPQHFALVQYNPDGSLDTNFNDTGKVITDLGGGQSAAAGLAIQSDRRIVVAGYGANNGTTSDFAVARYLDPRTFTATSLGSSGPGSLGQLVQQNNQLGGGNDLLVQAGAGFAPADVIQAVNALTDVTQPVTIVLDLGGGTYSTGGVVYGPSDPNTAQNVTWIVQNGILDPTLPALTVSGGHVLVQNCTLITTGDAPTILVTGGSLTLRNDIVQESTGSNDAAIQITGGSLNLAGGNTLSVIGVGQFIVSTGPSQVTAAGTTYQINGTTLPTAGIDALIAQVAALPLNNGERNSLTSTLQAAELALLRANATPAANQLNAFINQVNALVNSHRLGQLSADTLISEVDSLLAVLP